mmetsp:Transcript_1682/g.3119  ORF Transcript_1682/g.3119 Transcript_1682/m.3119 type:complete len:118 (+) Transcript_1682:6011-6364(+)
MQHVPKCRRPILLEPSRLACHMLPRRPRLHQLLWWANLRRWSQRHFDSATLRDEALWSGEVFQLSELISSAGIYHVTRVSACMFFLGFHFFLSSIARGACEEKQSSSFSRGTSAQRL